jgi:hypothetical protein
MMLKSAEDRLRGEVTEPLDAPLGRESLSGDRCGSPLVVTARVGNKNSTQMRVAQDYDVIEAFSTDRFNQ